MRNKKLTKMYVARMNLGITQEELAAKIGVTQPRISAWENLVVDIPPARRLELGRALSIDPDQLDQPAL